ncbi:hypothetical protein N781_05160 [Pontibacillus halophilus JSM 076056 = DSM 19796]|uniref:Lipoprotein n=1 Tax=Pontibacillus halophilus JSM 076056 = DSM 19796 TaxID=1385510 RepID=A0A0A5GIW5_9BACI|nr:hypothetical protein [Pontibacillus halophilus]KGX91168.1 hypothetical protein N781_05160 [Pontibacillus halophilus JSM 076056 = DSM 19796]
MNRLLLAIGVLVLLSACGPNDNLHFEGESPSWSGQLQVYASDEEMNGNYEFRLNSEDHPVIEALSIRINDGSTTLNDERVTTDKAITLPIKCSGCATLKNTSEIPVTIDWNGNTESFTLHLQQ